MKITDVKTYAWLCRIKQFLDLKRVDFMEVNLPKFA